MTRRVIRSVVLHIDNAITHAYMHRLNEREAGSREPCPPTISVACLEAS